jgi:hypothetical protein
MALSLSRNKKRFQYLDGVSLHAACWGKEYPSESLTYDNVIFRFYDTTGAITEFLPALFSPYMLICREYELAYDYIKNEEAKAAAAVFQPLPKRVLTGQPGIGAHTVLMTLRIPLITCLCIYRQDSVRHLRTLTAPPAQRTDGSPVGAGTFHPVRRRRCVGI